MRAILASRVALIIVSSWGFFPGAAPAGEVMPWGAAWRVTQEEQAGDAWKKPGFDDSKWLRLHGGQTFWLPFFGPPTGYSTNEKHHTNWSGHTPRPVAYCRAGLKVTGDASLSADLEYGQGVVVYVNGQEVFKDGTEAGAGKFATAKPVWKDGGFRAPTRKTGLALSGLRTGLNVIAVEVHCANPKQRGDPPYFYLDMSLTGAGAELVDGSKPGVDFWAVDLHQLTPQSAYGPPEATVARLDAAQNGEFATQVVLRAAAGGSARVTASDLKGPGTIPAENLRIRYCDYVPSLGLQDRRWLPDPKRGRISFEVPDKLLEEPPALKPNRAQPVWITVKVPKEAKPGVYRGMLSAAGASLPLEIRVYNVALPDPKDYRFVLSIPRDWPEVAREHGVAPWSEEHFQIIRQYVKELGRCGQKTCVAVIRTVDSEPSPWRGWGLKTGHIKWLKVGDGYRWDYTVFDRLVKIHEEELGELKAIMCLPLARGGGWMPAAGIRAFQFTPEGEKPIEVLTNISTRGKGQELPTGAEKPNPEYLKIIGPFLKDLTAHCHSKGWEKKLVLCSLWMDRGDNEGQLAAVRQYAPGLKWQGTLHYPDMNGYHRNLGKEGAHWDHMPRPEELRFLSAKYPMPPLPWTRKYDLVCTWHDQFCMVEAGDAPLHVRLACWKLFHVGLGGMDRGHAFTEVYPGQGKMLSSIRWEMWKEGIQDYELMAIAKERGKTELVEKMGLLGGWAGIGEYLRQRIRWNHPAMIHPAEPMAARQALLASFGQ